jgi:hypothetical protein
MSRGTSRSGGLRGTLRGIDRTIFIYLTSNVSREQTVNTGKAKKYVGSGIAATIIDGMKPEIIGRVFGTGVRVAGRMAWHGIASTTSTPSGNPQTKANTQVQASNSGNTQAAAQVGRKAGQTGRGVAKGLGGFVRPFRRVGGILWLEITGAFFLLPVVVFAPNIWRFRASWAAGPDHRTFLVSVIVVAVFLYLGVTSFWRANRRSRA